MTAFTRGSRNRLLKTLHSIDWPEVAPQGGLWIGLTYPGDPRHVPGERATVQAHLRRFQGRWNRRFGPARGIWKLEYQRRGAPHLHLMLVRPMTDDADDAIEEWCRRNWWEIVGSGDDDHLIHGAHVRYWVDANLLISYLTDYCDSKRYQHEAPGGFEDTGRWWGYWRIKPDRQVIGVSEQTYYRVRRAERKAYRAKRGKSMRCRTASYAGVWLATDWSAAEWVNHLLGKQVFEVRPATRGDPPGPPLSRVEIEDIFE